VYTLPKQKPTGCYGPAGLSVLDLSLPGWSQQPGHALGCPYSSARAFVLRYTYSIHPLLLGHNAAADSANVRTIFEGVEKGRAACVGSCYPDNYPDNGGALMPDLAGWPEKPASPGIPPRLSQRPCSQVVQTERPAL